jgi:hypothetical protein
MRRAVEAGRMRRLVREFPLNCCYNGPDRHKSETAYESPAALLISLTGLIDRPDKKSEV